jgi:outer membrane immunogenic protein
MMSRSVLAALALTGVGVAASAQAADLPYYPPAPGPAYVATPQSFYDPNCWAGPYLGGNFGFAWGSVDHNQTNPSGFVAGVQGGYNWQVPSSPWLFGLEGDIQVAGAEDTFAPWKFSNPWFGTLRGRVGYTFSNVLLYGTAGLAFGELRGETFGLSESHNNAGWTLGFGAEYLFAPKFSAKIEYLYVDLNNSNFSITGAGNGFQFGVVRAGINYHF